VTGAAATATETETETASGPPADVLAQAAGPTGLLLAIAWRNLWRNGRRTWFTAGGIAFACLLLLFSRSMQLGGYKGQVEATTALLTGHMQVQHERYLDDPKLEYRVNDAAAIAATLREHPRIIATALRSSSFALLSVDERSFGAQVIGVQPAVENQFSSFPSAVIEGRYLSGGQEAVLGDLLARNLGAGIGDELVVLGSGPEGGVAALAVTIVGIFSTGLSALDRALVQLPLEVFNEGFFLGDSASYIVLQFDDVDATEQVLADLDSVVPAGLALRPWQDLLPEVVQGIALDKVSAMVMYFIITVIVLFSIVNTFIMTVFERTREFGMLLAVGMHPWRVIGMLQLEALWLALLGGLLGAICAVPLLTWAIGTGIPLGGLEELSPGMIMPTHIRGGFALGQFLIVPLVFVVGCQFASLVPGLRLLRMKPVEALRAD
jgi:putative ABC transport system permease protein